MKAGFSYNKKEKLKSKKQLQKVFAGGNSFTVFPVKVFFILTDEQDAVIKTGVGVSSKNFKKAVERNRIKRLLREAYRTEKQPLITYLNNSQKKLAVFLLFIDKVLPGYKLIKNKMQVCLQRLMQQLNEYSSENT